MWAIFIYRCQVYNLLQPRRTRDRASALRSSSLLSNHICELYSVADVVVLCSIPDPKRPKSLTTVRGILLVTTVLYPDDLIDKNNYSI